MSTSLGCSKKNRTGTKPAAAHSSSPPAPPHSHPLSPTTQLPTSDPVPLQPPPMQPDPTVNSHAERQRDLPPDSPSIATHESRGRGNPHHGSHSSAARPMSSGDSPTGESSPASSSRLSITTSDVAHLPAVSSPHSQQSLPAELPALHSDVTLLTPFASPSPWKAPVQAGILLSRESTRPSAPARSTVMSHTSSWPPVPPPSVKQ